MSSHKYGDIGLDEAIALAEEKGLDVVEISPDKVPPVCKLMDYGKYKYEQQKKANEARKKQKVIEIKEIKMRPTCIDDHDYDVKMRAMKRFLLDEGDKVEVTLRFRGREMAHQQSGHGSAHPGREDTQKSSPKLEPVSPRMEGRRDDDGFGTTLSVRGHRNVVSLLPKLAMPTA